MPSEFSDEQLNAFIDNEIDSADKQRIFEALRRDEHLRKRVCELQKAHDLIRMTYQSIDPPTGYPPPEQDRPAPRFLRGMAAGLLLAAGTLLGWFAHQQSRGDGLPELAQAIQFAPTTTGATRRIMLHVSTDDEYRLNHMLEETERLLETGRENGERLRVEILANGPGLKLVKKSAGPAGQRLQRLQQRYDNLTVAACAQTLERLRAEKGIELELNPGTTLVKSALGEVLERQRQGWTYIRI